jgi:LPPG:FO 2-phospho-L-lactate transferase
VGGAKLAYGLAQIVPPEDLTIIVNTGDDFWLYGLRICPDLDTVTYTLSGLVDKQNGWGVADDTTGVLSTLEQYGADTWFRLGDKDLAVHLLRTMWLRKGQTLSQITRQLTERLGVRHHILPMADAPVGTIVDTVEYGELDFQTYFVKYRWQPTVRSLRQVGIESAAISSDVAEVIENADVILIGPSNPWLSIAPILAVPGIKAAITSRAVPRVAVTPIIEGTAVKGPAAKLMLELGYEVSAAAVAEYYADVINGFVFDERDQDLRVESMRAVALNTLMQSDADRVSLAHALLKWIGEWH